MLLTGTRQPNEPVRSRWVAASAPHDLSWSTGRQGGGGEGGQAPSPPPHTHTHGARHWGSPRGLWCVVRCERLERARGAIRRVGRALRTTAHAHWGGVVSTAVGGVDCEVLYDTRVRITRNAPSMMPGTVDNGSGVASLWGSGTLGPVSRSGRCGVLSFTPPAASTQTSSGVRVYSTGITQTDCL